MTFSTSKCCHVHSCGIPLYIGHEPQLLQSIKMHNPVFRILMGWRLHVWHHYFTWGLMSEFCPNLKNVLLSLYTVMVWVDLGQPLVETSRGSGLTLSRMLRMPRAE